MPNFDTYDFENDPLWKTFIGNKEFLDMNSPKAIKTKKEFFKRFIDPDFENEASQQAPSSEKEHHTEGKSPSNDVQRDQQLKHAAAKFVFLQINRGCCLVFGIAAVFTGLKSQMYIAALFTALLTFLVGAFGDLRQKGFNGANLKKSFFTPDGVYTTWCVMFMLCRSIFGIIPPALFSIVWLNYSLAQINNNSIKRFCSIIESNTQKILQYIASTELISIFSVFYTIRRNFILGVVFIIWYFVFICLRYQQAYMTSNLIATLNYQLTMLTSNYPTLSQLYTRFANSIRMLSRTIHEKSKSE